MRIRKIQHMFSLFVPNYCKEVNGQEDISEKVVDLQHVTFSNDVNFVSLTENNNKMCGTAYFYFGIPN